MKSNIIQFNKPKTTTACQCECHSFIANNPNVPENEKSYPFLCLLCDSEPCCETNQQEKIFNN